MVVLSACAPPSLAGFDSSEVAIGPTDLTVAVAATQSQRIQGLMYIDELPSGLDGMLFVFDSPVNASFHMRDTPMPLDIWWFDEEGRLVGSAAMEPCLNGDCVTYRSTGQVKWALETPEGAYGFTPGSILTVP